MPNGPMPVPGINQTTELIFLDQDGHAHLTLRTSEQVVKQPNGNGLVYLKSGETRELACGNVWGPHMPPNGPMQPGGICSFCCKPRRRWLFFSRPGGHGVCSLAAGRACDTCGAYTCPSHRRPGDDGLWRCPDCQRKAHRRAFFTWLFFKTEE